MKNAGLEKLKKLVVKDWEHINGTISYFSASVKKEKKMKICKNLKNKTSHHFEATWQKIEKMMSKDTLKKHYNYVYHLYVEKWN